MVELESEAKEEVTGEDSVGEREGEIQKQETPDLDSSSVELCKPKMKVFHGRTAPGLRIRSGPTFMVRSSSECSVVMLTCQYSSCKIKAEQLGIIKPEDCFTYSEEVSLVM